ncbi:phage protein [Proteus hauseri ATCC 700826]|uniref:Phage protein n=1 Tax=Proteus hauseri ATCC 700826 TaxID=1354271 RepID=A0AAJ3LTA6_PROHU|nr:capsid cement protein [Proteus hauseri]OAT46099.1 phage protein [Proteus hauseri ATCC 700826]
MAKNYVQQGGTIALVNSTKEIIKSGQLVHVGAIAGVAITDIQPSEKGDGFSEGVFLLNKKAGIALKAGATALVKDNVVVDTGGTPAGVVWDDADASSENVTVKLNVFAPAGTP